VVVVVVVTAAATVTAAAAATNHPQPFYIPQFLESVAGIKEL
jgi:hypothetical protein